MRKFKKAYIEITNVCNKKCTFCHGTKREARFMPESEFDKILCRLSGATEYLYFHVLGEPMLHPDVIRFIELSSDKGFKATVTTNGTLPLDSLLGSGAYKVQISLHSFDGEGLEDYIKRLASFAVRAGKEGILVEFRLWNLNSGEDNSETERELKKAFPDPWKEGREGSFTLSENIFLSYAERFEWPDIEGAEINTSLFCYGLRDQIAILADGTVVPCCLDADGEIPLGNIFTDTLENILSSSRAEQIYNGFSNRCPAESLCRRCLYARRFDK